MTKPTHTYRRGSVVLRGDQIPRLTADASLLQSEQSADWKHEDPWRVLRIQSEFVEGLRGAGRGRSRHLRLRVRTDASRGSPSTSALSGSATCSSSVATRSSPAVVPA